MLALAALVLAPQVFAAPLEITGRVTSPAALFARDMDGDGHLDLVAGGRGSSGVDIARGLGDGRFRPFARALRVEVQLAAVEIADLDADGIPEIITYGVLGDVSVGRRDARGIYAPREIAQLSSVGAQGVAAVAAGDLDSDGDLDLFACSESSDNPALSAVLFENLGADTFSSPIPARSVPFTSGAGALADINGDGQLDVVARRGFSAVDVALGTGTVETLVNVTVASDAVRLVDLEVADLTGNGVPDIVMKDGSGRVKLARGLGFGIVAPPVTLTERGEDSTGLRLADFNGDGALGFVEIDGDTGDARVFLNLAGVIQPGPILSPISTSSVRFRSAATGDFNGDGIVDVALSHSGGQVSVYLGTQAPYRLGPAPDSTITDDRIGLAPSSEQNRGFVAGDFDGDGIADLIGVNGRDSTLRLFRINSAGRLAPTFPECPAPAGINALTAADFDGDGALDLLLDPASSSSVPSSGLRWMRNIGGGLFAPAEALQTGGTSRRVGDLNGDGADDIVTYSFVNGGRLLRVVYGGPNSAITGLPTQLFPPDVLNTAARDNQVGDVDGDGVDDLLFQDPADSSSLLILFGSPGGLDASVSTSIPLTGTVSVLKIGDFDGDGHPGALLEIDNSGTPILLESTGTGSFLAPQPWIELSEQLPDPSLFEDLNADGVEDVLLDDVGPSDEILGIFRGASSSDWAVAPIGNLDNLDANSFRFGDFDGDGDTDIVRLTTSIVYHQNLTQENGPGSACGAAPLNSAGGVGRLAFDDPIGSSTAPNTLLLSGLPPSTFGFVVTSRSLVAPASIPGSVGQLCLGAPIGRFVGPGQILLSGPTGGASLLVDPAALPLGPQPVAAAPGETWHFQAWYRDVDESGNPSSNLTIACSIRWR